MARFILHSDLNNFYASVECLYNPSLRNKAVAVVGDQEKRHGIVLAKNYIAKKYGVKTGDTVWEAKQKCLEELVCVTANFERYYYVSKLVKQMYLEYTDRVESFGIDEAWLDVSRCVKSFDEAFKLAETIRKRVLEEFGLTVSIGVSFNKIFAKLGSDLKKPNATTLISTDNFKNLVWPLAASELLYVGRATTQKLAKAGINTIGDIANTPVQILKSMLGKNGETLHTFACGADLTEVKRWDELDEIKSIGNSTTCPRNLKTNEEVRAVISVLAESVARRMREKNLWANTVCLFIKTDDLKSFDVMHKLEYPTNLASVVATEAYKLFKFDWNKTIRAVGVRVTNLTEKPLQYNLFNSEQNMQKKEKFETVIDNLRGRFGYDIIKRGSVLAIDDFDEINPEHVTHTIHPVSYFKNNKLGDK
ncbi:MAG: DNA polymerase IV [Clostridia bacterium]|nr:DNA polymerase IV [Clostridia bacterium]